MAVSSGSVSTMGIISQSNERESHWFDSERFLDPQFNAEQYVADLRRYVSPGPNDLQRCRVQGLANVWLHVCSCPNLAL